MNKCDIGMIIDVASLMCGIAALIFEIVKFSIEQKKERCHMRKVLRDARISKKMTQKQVAEYLNIIERHYKAIEYGERLGSITVWDKLEDLFGINQRFLREISEIHLDKEDSR